MSGNVRDWVWDWAYREYTSATVTDPLGPVTGAGRVQRGGSWNSFARYCRAAHRFWSWPGGRDGSLGFRPARSSP